MKNDGHAEGKLHEEEPEQAGGRAGQTPLASGATEDDADEREDEERQPERANAAVGELEIDVQVVLVGQEAAVGIGFGESGDGEAGPEVPQRGAEDELAVNGEDGQPGEEPDGREADSGEFPRAFDPAPGKQCGDGHEQAKFGLGHAAVDDPQDERGAQVVGGFQSHAQPAKGGLQADAEEGGEHHPAHRARGGGSTASCHPEQGDREDAREGPDADMHDDGGGQARELRHGREPGGGDEGDEQRPAVAPNPGAENRREQAEPGAEKTVPVFEADGQIAPPALGVERAKTQRPVRHGHAGVVRGDEAADEDQHEGRRHDALRVERESGVEGGGGGVHGAAGALPGR